VGSVPLTGRGRTNFVQVHRLPRVPGKNPAAPDVFGKQR
jgi:hypothetical protein